MGLALCICGTLGKGTLRTYPSFRVPTGMSERTAQWRNGRNGNQNIIKLLTMLKFQFPLWARVPVRVREHTLELRFRIDCGIVFCIGILDTPS